MKLFVWTLFIITDRKIFNFTLAPLVFFTDIFFVKGEKIVIFKFGKATHCMG
jgi:hypothetical protein